MKLEMTGLKRKYCKWKRCCIIVSIIVIIYGFILIVFNNDYYINYGRYFGMNTNDLFGYNNKSMNNIDLSIIITTRNDNHGNNPIKRLYLMLNQLIVYQWKLIHNINVEIIIIEWNYIETNIHINEHNDIKLLFNYNKENQNTIIKYYKISSKYNDTKNCYKKYNICCPFFQYYPKNVGIRRSNGEWILITNMDDIFSIKLMNILGHYISNNLFNPNGIYQAKHNEINLDTLNHIPLSLIKTPNDITNSNTNNCLLTFDSNKTPLLPWGGDFTLLSKDNIYNNYVGGYLESCTSSMLDSEFISRQIYINKLTPYYIAKNCSYFHIQHERISRQQGYINNISKALNCTHDCMKVYTKSLYDLYKKGKGLRSDIRTAWSIGYIINWTNEYYVSHQTWGLNGIQLEYVLY